MLILADPNIIFKRNDKISFPALTTEMIWRLNGSETLQVMYYNNMNFSEIVFKSNIVTL